MPFVCLRLGTLDDFVFWVLTRKDFWNDNTVIKFVNNLSAFSIDVNE